jgi:hypothetical protein
MSAPVLARDLPPAPDTISVWVSGELSRGVVALVVPVLVFIPVATLFTIAVVVLHG